MTRERNAFGGNALQKPICIAVTPFSVPDVDLLAALRKTAALAVLALGSDPGLAAAALRRVPRGPRPFGVRLNNHTLAIDLPASAEWVILDRPRECQHFREQGRNVLVEVLNVEEALHAVSLGAAGLIAKGHEAAGRVGEESTFVLLQRLLKTVDVPVWCQGGIGTHSAAAVIAAGAHGFVIDTQLAVMREATAAPALVKRLAQLDGTETRVVGGYRVYAPPAVQSPEVSATEDVETRLGVELDREQWVPMGQDVAFGRDLAERWDSVASLIRHLIRSVTGNHRLVQSERPLREHNAFAKQYGLRYPVIQGPMTRVSDRPEFARAVAEGGALPFIALALERGESAKRLLFRARELLGARPWGVGILGFVDESIRREQLALLKEVKPPFALVAGARVALVRELQQLGIETFVHVPSARLLTQFLKEGVTRFVLEGRECGGHVGPRTSSVLWETAMEVLLAFPRPETLTIVFAGGIHDARSAAIAAAFAAPLAARGTSVAVLMGTAYLFTQEIVETGAVNAEFQRIILDSNSTVTLESGLGHATRAAPTPFTKVFLAERAALIAAGEPSAHIQAVLEGMNLGRLRLASKGLERVGDQLVAVPADRQSTEGLYMVGQVAALRTETTTIAALHEEVTSSQSFAAVELESTSPKFEPIAIIGMAGVFPGADDSQTFFHNVMTGEECIREVPHDRWPSMDAYDPTIREGKTNSKWGGFISPQQFDPAEFGIPPTALGHIDPAQLLALLVVKRALRDAGIELSDLDGETTSIILGTVPNSGLTASYVLRMLLPVVFGRIPENLDSMLPSITEDTFPGVLPNVTAGRVANRLGFGGPNFIVDAACASSLAALDAACKELMLGTSNVAIAGGIDPHIGLVDYLYFSSVSALSPTGKCRTFDAAADGTVLGECAAALVLKRLEDAKRDGDRVYAVITGIGSSSDGRAVGLTAPRRSGQQLALARAYEKAGFSIADVELIEAHGTGTVLGDRTELRALTDFALEAGSTIGSCTLGSVKSQIGHTRCAAGMAGVIKSALSIYHGVLPPTYNLTTTNAVYVRRQSPFVFRTEVAPWLRAQRRAGVSAFGFGGTNFHVVLQESSADRQPLRRWSHELFTVRGADAAQARERATSLLQLLEAHPNVELAVHACTAASLGDADPVQFAFVSADVAQATRALTEIVAGSFYGPECFVRDAPVAGKIALLFPGQGSQHLYMGSALLMHFPHIANLFLAEPDLVRHIFPGEVFDSAERNELQQRLADTRIAQPALGLMSLAFADLLVELGLRADLVAGHSYGELTALCFAGAMPRESLVDVSRARASAMLRAAGSEPGTMAVVFADFGTTSSVVASFDECVIANINSPLETVISGRTTSVERAIAAFEARGVRTQRIPVAAAFHSPVLQGADEDFHKALALVKLSTPQLPVWSNVTAKPHSTDSAEISALLAKQLVSTVRFESQIRSMYDHGARVFVEVGPGAALTGSVGRILEGKHHCAVALDRRSTTSIRPILGALAQLAVVGPPLDVLQLFRGRGVTPLTPRSSSSSLNRPQWRVDGQYTRPAFGELPARTHRPLTRVASGWPAAEARPSSREELVVDHMRTMQQLIALQRDVMLRYLGGSTSVIDAPAESAPQSAATPSSREQPQAGPPRLPGLRPIERLLSIIEERTGYPREMLELRLDLEADLGIDSIKRTEIMSSLAEGLALASEASAELVERSASLRTLEELDHFLSTLSTTGATHPGTSEGASAESSRKGDRGGRPQIRSLLIRLIAERTGYPEDMLGGGLDLESDLGIDSIKRVEIFGTFAEELGLDLTALGGPLTGETGGALTIDSVVDQIGAQLSAPVAAAVRSDPPTTPRRLERETSARATTLSRLVAEVTESVLPSRSLDANRRFIVSGGRGGLAEALAGALSSHGEQVKILPVGSPVSGQNDFLIFLGALDPELLDPAKALFQMTLPMVRRGAPGVLAFVSVNGFFGLHAESQSAAGGVAGFLRTLRAEEPSACVRAINIDRKLSANDLADIVLREAGHASDVVEVGYRGGSRFQQRYVARNLPEQPQLDLNGESVVLFTGGGRGITAQVATSLASRFRCRIELIGRTALPAQAESAHTRDCSQKQQLVRTLAATLPNGTPIAEIERHAQAILSAREVQATLDALKSIGVAAHYHCADVTDEGAVGRVIEAIYDRYGRLDGIVHGAGLIEDQLLKHKTVASFDRVYDTKVRGARALLATLRRDTRFVAFFSSVASVFGSRGQADYAAANDYLDKLAHRLATERGLRAFTVNWGPWGRVGMVSPELERAFRARGIELLEPSHAAEAFVDELVRGTDEQVVLAASGWSA